MIRAAGLAGLVLALLSACGEGREAAGGPAEGICGVPGLVGAEREPFSDGGACGITRPVSVTRVAGVNLNRPALLSCPAARALDRWVRTSAKPAVGRRGGGLATMRVAASYACRTRNSRPGARISEHAKGNAIDISAFTFANGKTVTVLEGWKGPRRDRRMLRAMHGAACGPFGTVLGPASDRFHRDHFHFDVAGYRVGPYCR